MTNSNNVPAGAGVDPAIEITADGPIKVVGPVRIVRRRSIRNARGAGIAWEDVSEVPTTGETWLCRCGQSGKKPFCDGSHRRDFTAEDACPAQYEESANVVGGVGLIIRDDRQLCMHAKFCFYEEGNVWKQADETGDDQVRAAVVAMVERCPSGALTLRIDGEADDFEGDTRPTVAVIDDGPLWVIGAIPITLADGSELEPRNRVTLCRCGQSAAKPLCDGAHSKAGFRDAAG